MNASNKGTFTYGLIPENFVPFPPLLEINVVNSVNEHLAEK